MGADALIAITVLEKDATPDWNAARRHILTAPIEELDPVGYYDDVPDADARQALLAQLGHFAAHFTDYGHRDISTIVTATHDLYLSGGMSWGDAPTNSYEAIMQLDAAGALQAAGFDPPSFWLAPPPRSYEISRKDLLA